MLGVRPTFKPLIVKDIQAEANEILQDGFPVEVFPDRVQQIIRETESALQFPVDYSCAAVLAAGATAIRKQLVACLKNDFEQFPLIYLLLVGRPGVNKSQPLYWFLRPILTKDRELYEHFSRDRDRWEEEQKLSKGEKVSNGISESEEPLLRQIIVQDVTVEKLAKVLQDNEFGVGAYFDEGLAWIKNFNRYTPGSEEQVWLQIFSSKPIKLDRKGSGQVYIPEPFVSVCGTIQPGVFSKLFKDHSDNGFLDRVLLAWPEDQRKEAWTDLEVSSTTILSWSNIVEKLLNISGETMRVPFSQAAKDILARWQRDITERMNEGTDEDASILAKMELYAIRFSLILQALFFACGEDSLDEISERAAGGAVKLCGYFEGTAHQARKYRDSRPFDRLSGLQKSVILALPETFSTSEGADIAEEEGMNRRTFERFLCDRRFFRQKKHGQYERV